MRKKLTIEYIKNYVEDNSNCNLISTEFINSKTKLKFRCSCGEVFEAQFHKFKTGKKMCKKCTFRKITIEDVRKYVEENSDCKLLSTEYIDCYTKLKFRCSCGEVFEKDFVHFKTRQKKCQKCTGGISYFPEEFEKLFKEKSNNEYELLTEYINQKNKITIRHLKCGHIYNVNPSSFLSGKRCPICQHRSYKKTTQEFQNELDTINGTGKYIVLSEYKDNRSKVLIKHCDCNRVFYAIPYNMTYSKSGCPYCKESHGEKEIALYLDNHNITYLREYKFNNCKNIRKLPFDFYIPGKNMIIEFDGSQHFQPKFGQQSFKQTKYNDNIKNKYCDKNNITLIRIPYTKINKIESILDSAFK